MVQSIDTWRGLRASLIGLGLLLSALGLVWLGEPKASGVKASSQLAEEAGAVSAVEMKLPSLDPPPGLLTSASLIEQLWPLPKAKLSQVDGPLGRGVRLAGEASLTLSWRKEAGVYLGVLGVGCPEGIATCEARVRVDKNNPVEIKLQAASQLMSFEVGALAAGLGSVGVRLSSGSGSAAVFRHLSLIPMKDEFQLAFGTSWARPFLLSGFDVDEVHGDRAFVWSAGLSSELGVVLAPSSGVYELKILAHAAPEIAPLEVRALVNGQPVGARRFGQGWGYQSYLVPAGSLKRGLNWLRFEYPETFRPADIQPGSRDRRELALRFERLWLSKK